MLRLHGIVVINLFSRAASLWSAYTYYYDDDFKTIELQNMDALSGISVDGVLQVMILVILVR